jgi:hypothetical protein
VLFLDHAGMSQVNNFEFIMVIYIFIILSSPLPPSPATMFFLPRIMHLSHRRYPQFHPVTFNIIVTAIIQALYHHCLLLSLSDGEFRRYTFLVYLNDVDADVAAV